MKTFLTAAAALATLTALPVLAGEGPVPARQFGRLDHVFVIMMENHAANEIIGNPNTPFINAYAARVNQATNYYAVGHPSLTNYLEVVGGSNFGITNDFYLNWPTTGCVDNLPGSTSCAGAVSPIGAPGTDAASPLTVDPVTDPQIGNSSLPPGTPAAPNNWSLIAYPAASFTPKTIAHQLAERGGSWKTYQQSLPSIGPQVAGVNYSDGFYSNLSPVAAFTVPSSVKPVPVQKLYAVKHNPFVYFLDVEQSQSPPLGLSQVTDFSGPHGLFADLATGHVPTFSFIAPNQCSDMHSAGGGSAQCSDSPHVLQQGDATVQQLIGAIHASPAWRDDDNRSAIVLLWDENDYGNAPNNVVFTVETNYGRNGATSQVPYDHFSLTKTLEAAFDLPCLNHACDDSSKVMNDLFR